jgi:hypothetical protein
VFEFLDVVEAVDGDSTTVVEIAELLWGLEQESALLFAVGTGQELVEDVEAALSLSLVNDSRLFEQVDLKTGSRDEARVVELKSDEFTETRRVVVLVGLGITEGFEHGVQFDQLVLEDWPTGDLLVTSSDVGDVLNDLLGVFGFTGSRLSSDEERLVLSVVEHGTVGGVRDGEDVWCDFVSSLAAVDVHHVVGVDGEKFVWVDYDAEKTRVGVDHIAFVSLSQVVEHGGFGQVRQFGAILDTIELWWIHEANLIFLDLYFVSLFGSDYTDTSGGAENFSWDEASLFVRCPSHLLVSIGGDREARVLWEFTVLVIIGEFLLTSHLDFFFQIISTLFFFLKVFFFFKKNNK